MGSAKGSDHGGERTTTGIAAGSSRDGDGMNTNRRQFLAVLANRDIVLNLTGETSTIDRIRKSQGGSVPRGTRP